MKSLYNKRDIQQECSKRIKAIRGETTESWSIHNHILTIYYMIAKLAEYNKTEN